MNKSFLIFGGSALLILIIALLLVFGGRDFFFDAPKISLNLSPSVSALASPVESKNPEASPFPTVSVQTPVRDFVFTASDFKYSLSEITVAKGDVVRIVLQNTNGTHDLRIDEFNVATKILKTGEEQMVEFIADKTGRFEFYCSIGTHRQMGMKGKLIVE